MQHIVLPALSYDYRKLEKETPPLFDSEELLEDLSEVGFTLTNRLRDEDGEFLTVRLREAYDFRHDDDNFKPLEIDMFFDRVVTLAFGIDYDWYAHKVTKSNSNIALEYGRVKLKGGHSHTGDDITMYNLGISLQASPAVTVRSGAWYNATGGELERLRLGLTYTSQCWAATLDYTRRPDEHIVFLIFTLKGLGDIEL